ncbi:MAG: A/G-specific adenine glycosylase [Phycisphaeraceae bacterium]
MTSPPAELLSSDSLARFRRSLLAWYDAHHRTMPWRVSPGAEAGRPEPYPILVAETMLQQTQVATVIPYFQRFIERFPTVAALASAEEQEVLRLWQGLGYYRRARNLHAAAKRIVDEFGGTVPGEVEKLLELPGVGRYTAGAVASIAFGRRAPIVDGNVARVLARLLAIEEPVDKAAVRRRLWEVAEAVVPGDRPGDFNQAMMELGSQICTPQGPTCPRCPVAEQCLARQDGREEEIPAMSPRKQPKAVTHVVAAVERRGRWLFEQRPEAGLWANLWQMPTWEWDQPAEVDEQAVAAWLSERTGLKVEPAGREEPFVHQTTHRRITFELTRWRVTGGRLRTGAGAWRPLRSLGDLPLSNPQRRVVGVLEARGPGIASFKPRQAQHCRRSGK